MALLLSSAAAFSTLTAPGSNKRDLPAAHLPRDPEITRRHVINVGVALSSGARQTISEVVSCAGERHYGRWGWQYTRTPFSGYAIFPGREVVVAYLPRVCLAPDGTVPATFVPLVVWVDDAESPSIMQFIVHHRYYEQATFPRVRITELKVERSWGAGVKPDSRFAGIENTLEDGHLPRGPLPAHDLDSIFYGVTAYVYPESVWRSFPSLAQHLETLTDTTLIDWQVIRGSGITGRCGVAEVGAGPDANCAIWGFDSRPYSHAMMLQGGIWLLDESAPGVERFHLLRRYDPVKERCSTQPKSCEFFQHTFRVSVGSKEFLLIPGQSRFAFDPKARRLLFMIPKLFVTRLMN
jgi:hypothetical protein